MQQISEVLQWQLKTFAASKRAATRTKVNAACLSKQLAYNGLYHLQLRSPLEKRAQHTVCKIGSSSRYSR